MFNLGALASNVLNSIDNVAKETLEEPKVVSATAIRSKRKTDFSGDQSENSSSYGEMNNDETSHSEKSNSLREDIGSTISPEGNETKLSISQLSSTMLSGTNLLPQKINSTLEDSDLRKTLKKKDQEIEKLNGECLEYEEQCNALKKEVQEAWDNYKSAQEKAAAREAELLDEIKMIQKAKLLDKQQSVTQLTKLNEDLSLSIKQNQLTTKEKEELNNQILKIKEENKMWPMKMEELELALKEARSSSVQGVQSLRDELRNAQNIIEKLHNDHAALMKQNSLRQASLERENNELTVTITEQLKEIKRLSSGANAEVERNSHQYLNKEYIDMQQEILRLSSLLEDEKEKNGELQNNIKQNEIEFRASQISNEEERKRLKLVIEQLQQQQISSSGVTDEGKSQVLNGLSSPWVGMMNPHDNQKDGHHPLEQELQSLSQILLKKQSVILDLQAERSTMKANLQDLEKKCMKMEKMLNRFRSKNYLDEDDDDEEECDGDQQSVMNHVYYDPEGRKYDKEKNSYDDIESVDNNKNYNSISSGIRDIGNLKNRKAMQLPSLKSISKTKSKVITDLELMGVKPGVGVTRAVTFIDAWTLVTGRVLRNYPWIRLGFVVYLLILHLWVLMVLVVHTHSLELDTNPKQSLNP